MLILKQMSLKSAGQNMILEERAEYDTGREKKVK
jgi:hypothetical protein